MNLIVCVDNQWGIGKDGELLYAISPDLARFKKLTTNNILIMGRKTFESLPNQKPLPNRINIVLTSDSSYYREGVITVNSVAEIKQTLSKLEKREVFVIGGGEVYKLLLPYCKKLYITKVNQAVKADTFFPNIDQDANFKSVSVSETFVWNEDTEFFYQEYDNINHKEF